MARPKLKDRTQIRRGVTVSLNGLEHERLRELGGSKFLQRMLTAGLFPSTELAVASIKAPVGFGAASVTLRCVHSGAVYGPYRDGDSFRVDLFQPLNPEKA